MDPKVFRPVYDRADDAQGTLPRALVPAPRRPADSSPWVTPDYSLVTPDDQLRGDGPFDAWPGPPLVMPHGLLPDGKPATDDPVADARRIQGVPAPTLAEADAVLWAYRDQQNYLRAQHGLPRAKRQAPDYRQRDTEDTLAAIVEIHRRERDRRLRRAG